MMMDIRLEKEEWFSSSFKSDVIIRSGLGFGDELITTGSAFLNDGALLNIVESSNNDLASQ